jgi:hypothetical protein
MLIHITSHCVERGPRTTDHALLHLRHAPSLQAGFHPHALVRGGGGGGGVPAGPRGDLAQPSPAPRRPPGPFRREKEMTLSCLVLYTPRAGRTLPAGEGGCAAGSLPPSHYLRLGPAVRCRSSPEFPFRFIWVPGWPTRYLCPQPVRCHHPGAGCRRGGLLAQTHKGKGRDPQNLNIKGRIGVPVSALLLVPLHGLVRHLLLVY